MMEFTGKMLMADSGFSDIKVGSFFGCLGELSVRQCGYYPKYTGALNGRAWYFGKSTIRSFHRLASYPKGKERKGEV